LERCGDELGSSPAYCCDDDEEEDDDGRV